MTDKQFSFLFNQAKELMQKSADPVHGWSHCERVIDNALKIKKLLPKDKSKNLDNKILILAGAWHDICFIFYNPNLINLLREGKRAAKITKRYYQQAGLKNAEVELICDIIRHHIGSTFGILNKKRSLYHQIIQDADTLDSFESPSRIKQVNKLVEKSFWYKIIAKILKPLFFNFLKKHLKFIYNLPEIIKRSETTNTSE